MGEPVRYGSADERSGIYSILQIWYSTYAGKIRRSSSNLYERRTKGQRMGFALWCSKDRRWNHSCHWSQRRSDTGGKSNLRENRTDRWSQMFCLRRNSERTESCTGYRSFLWRMDCDRECNLCKRRKRNQNLYKVWGCADTKHGKNSAYRSFDSWDRANLYAAGTDRWKQMLCLWKDSERTRSNKTSDWTCLWRMDGGGRSDLYKERN